MRVRSSILADDDGRRYRRLNTAFGESFPVFPNVPIDRVVHLDGSTDAGFNLTEQVLIEDATFCYVVCDQEHRPLVVIDCDTQGYGFNEHGRYVPLHPISEVEAAVLATKAKVMRSLSMPYVIVGPECFDHVADGISLSIVEGLVGQILASQEFTRAMADPALFEKYAGPHADLDDSDMTPELRLEIAVKREFNPVFRRYHETLNEVARPGFRTSCDYDGLVLPEGGFGQRFTVTTRIEVPELGTGESRVVMNRYVHDGDDLTYGFNELAEHLGFIAAASDLIVRPTGSTSP